MPPGSGRATRPVLPLLRGWFPGHVATTEEVGRAMLAVARHGASHPIVENRDINALATAARPRA